MSRRRRRRPATREVTLRHRIRYRFDNMLARGTGAALVWLGVVTLLSVVLSALLLAVFNVTLAGSASGSWLEDFWQSLLRVLDTGTMASDVGWGRRVLALLVTIFGVLVAGTLIGLIAHGVEERIDRMQRGRSVVIESGHIVILGGSRRIPLIVQQLVLANAGRDASTIVVLADEDPTALRAAVVDVVPDRLGTNVVYRSGDPTRRTDLAIVRIDQARGAIVLSDRDDHDGAVAQTVIAIRAELGEHGHLPIVVEAAERETVERLQRACGADVHGIVTAEAVARTAAFALRRRGLIQVVEELTDFRGCDLHVVDQPDARGLRFEALVGRYANARVIGVAGDDGGIELAPSPDRVVAARERLVIIAADLSTLEEVDEPVSMAATVHDAVIEEPVEEHVLVVGWNRLGTHLLTGWATAARASSTVEVVFDPRLVAAADVIVPPIGVPVVVTEQADVSTWSARRKPTTVVFLGYESLGASEADARTLLDVLLLRRRFATDGAAPRFIVELLDSEHLDLAELDGPDDFLISAELGCQFIAQLVEQPERRAVLLSLYSGSGASIRMIRCEHLGLVGEITGAAVVAATAAVGVVGIGWRRASARGGDLVLNPHISTRAVLEPDDEIVVVG